MEIQIISNDSFIDVKSVSKVVWEKSRPLDDDTNIGQILAIDAPVNEFPSVTMYIECTVIEREVFATMRDHVMWARTSRVDDVKQFTTPVFFSGYNSIYSGIRHDMAKMHNEGVSQDQYRLITPLVSYTGFTVKMNLRSLIKLCKTFLILAAESKSTEASVMFYESSNKMLQVIEVMVPSGVNITDVVASIKPIDLFPKTEKFESGSVGDCVVVSTRVPFALRAQIVRHRLFSIKDSLYDTIVDVNLPRATFSELVNVQISADKQTWLGIIKKRSCWLAQYDIWSPVIAIAQKYCGVDKSILPCSNGLCPYIKDAELRMTDKDPGSPCPRYAIMKGYPLTDKQLTSCEEQLHLEGRPDFWQSMINKLG